MICKLDYNLNILELEGSTLRAAFFPSESYQTTSNIVVTIYDPAG